MTFLPAKTKGRWFFLYLILDLYSRKVIGWEVHDTDEADHAAHLVRRTALAEGVNAIIAERGRLEKEVAAWERRRNAEGARIQWMFTTERAREKMARAYPQPSLAPVAAA